jgi:hypothetical protein
VRRFEFISFDFPLESLLLLSKIKRSSQATTETSPPQKQTMEKDQQKDEQPYSLHESEFCQDVEQSFLELQGETEFNSNIDLRENKIEKGTKDNQLVEDPNSEELQNINLFINRISNFLRASDFQV